MSLSTKSITNHTITLFATLLLAALTPLHAADEPGENPNILIILADGTSITILSGTPWKRLETRKTMDIDPFFKSPGIAADSVEFKVINYTLLQRELPERTIQSHTNVPRSQPTDANFNIFISTDPPLVPSKSRTSDLPDGHELGRAGCRKHCDLGVLRATPTTAGRICDFLRLGEAQASRFGVFVTILQR